LEATFPGQLFLIFVLSSITVLKLQGPGSGLYRGTDSDAFFSAVKYGTVLAKKFYQTKDRSCDL
jgi:hypothetical protein